MVTYPSNGQGWGPAHQPVNPQQPINLQPGNPHLGNSFVPPQPVPGNFGAPQPGQQQQIFAGPPQGGFYQQQQYPMPGPGGKNFRPLRLTIYAISAVLLIVAVVFGVLTHSVKSDISSAKSKVSEVNAQKDKYSDPDLVAGRSEEDNIAIANRVINNFVFAVVSGDTTLGNKVLCPGSSAYDFLFPYISKKNNFVNRFPNSVRKISSDKYDVETFSMAKFDGGKKESVYMAVDVLKGCIYSSDTVPNAK